MSVEISLLIPDEPPAVRQFSTNQGAAEFSEWAAGLSEEDYPDLWHFAEYGWAQGLDAIYSQCIAALAAHPPGDDVESIVIELIEYVAHQDPEGVVMLGDPG